jgi:lipid-A-disaccharide synthase
MPRARRVPSPRAAVALELARTLAGFAAAPAQVLDFLLRRDALRDELRSYLDRPARIDPDPPAPPSRAGALEVFVSCAETSGEIHAANLVAELRALAPHARFQGLGGERLAAAGVERLGNPVERATMGFDGVVSALPYYLGLLERCAERFRDARPSVAVLVDSPALHVPLGRIARRFSVPVVHFVTPQHWAWAPWRTSGYSRSVDRALTILPFEPAWFARRGVRVSHVGHPLLDQLARVPASRPSEASTTLAVLPGSRARVIDLNLPWMLAALARFRRRAPEADVAILQGGREHEARIAGHVAAAGASGWARAEIGDLHRNLRNARAALSVSGTVLLDLLHHRLPAVAVYRVASRRDELLYRHGLATPWFASVNLLSARETYPEFCFRGRGPLDEVAGALERIWSDGEHRRRVARGLELAAERLGPPGACRRAALHALALAAEREGARDE